MIPTSYIVASIQHMIDPQLMLARVVADLLELEQKWDYQVRGFLSEDYEKDPA